MIQAQINLPLYDNDGKSVKKVHKQLEVELCSKFGGCTTSSGRGKWLDKGKLLPAPEWVIYMTGHGGLIGHLVVDLPLERFKKEVIPFLRVVKAGHSNSLLKTFELKLSIKSAADCALQSVIGTPQSQVEFYRTAWKARKERERKEEEKKEV